MAIISDFDEDEHKETHSKPLPSQSPSPSSSSSSSSFSASFDPSNPVAFLERVFDFVSQESDFFGGDAADKEIASLVRAAKEKRKKKAEEVKAAEAEEKKKAEKRLKEERKKKAEELKAAEAEEKKEHKAAAEDTKKEESGAARGNNKAEIDSRHSQFAFLISNCLFYQWLIYDILFVLSSGVLAHMICFWLLNANCIGHCWNTCTLIFRNNFGG